MEAHRPASQTAADRERPSRRQRRDAAPLDAAWLEAEAVRHLARWESTRHVLKDVLERRLRKRCERTGEDPDGLLAAIPAVVDGLVSRGYVDDRRFATQLIERGRRQGKSRAFLRARLRSKGIDPAMVGEIEAERRAARASDGDPSTEVTLDEELESAWRSARKRRIGPYCLDPVRRSENRQRHLAALARQGFSREVAFRVVDADAPPESDR